MDQDNASVDHLFGPADDADNFIADNTPTNPLDGIAAPDEAPAQEPINSTQFNPGLPATESGAAAPAPAEPTEAEYKAELAELRQKQALIEQQMQQHLTAQQQRALAQQQAQQQQFLEEVSYEDDPAEYLRRRSEALTQTVQQMHQFLTHQQQAQQQQQAVQQFRGTVEHHEAQFRQTTPDYDEATDYLRSKRDADLQAFGVSDPQQRQAVIQQELTQLAHVALSNGKSPAEVAYYIARQRGWTGRQQQAPQQPSAPQRQAPTRYRQPVRANSRVPGHDNDQSLQQLLDLTGDEFDEAWNKRFPGPVIW